MTTLIVLEGCDGTAKSTVAEELNRILRWPIQKFGEPHSKSDAYRSYFKFLQNVKTPTVVDRSWLGEFVYVPMFRNYVPDYFEDVEALAGKHQILYILMNADWNWCVSHVKGTSPFDKAIQNETIFNAEQEAFIQIFNKVKSGEKIVISPQHFTGPLTMSQCILTITRLWMDDINFYARCKPMYALTAYHPYWRFVEGHMRVDKDCTCGHFRDHQLYPFFHKYHSITWGMGNIANPKAIFIGEAPGMHGCGTTGLPFYFDRSGFYLKWLLFKRRIAETEYYMTNISKCTPKNNKLNMEFAEECAKQHLVRELKELPATTPIVALGRTAEAWLDEHGYASKFIHHPAWPLYTGNYADYQVEFDSVLKEIGL
jgi:uracil-DNA glycosylase family 4